MDIASKPTFSTIQAALFEEKTTCEALVRQYLQNIRSHKNLNIYVEVFEEEAINRAKTLDEKRAKGENTGRLFGLVVSIKDVICYAGHEVTAASKILEGFTSLFSSTAVERLLAEDAIIIGRTNCDQFAMGSTNENSIYGPVRNAADPTKVPGGSSGGAAVAVQANTCTVALGSDTGGSVRQPAAFCGVIGIKPTYGRISRHGLLAYGSSFDQIGVLAHHVEDIALTLEVIAGKDDFDSTSSPSLVPTYSELAPDSKTKRIAYFSNTVYHKGMDPIIKEVTLSYINQLKSEGHTVEGIEFDLLEYLIPAYYVLTTAEASSNLSRYDGIRYGHRSTTATNLEETYRKSRTEGFSEEVKRRIMLGTFVLSAGYYDAYYTKAQKVRRLLADKIAAIFETYDFILMPASPQLPWNIGDMDDDPVTMYLADIYTVTANMAGVPAIAFPIGVSENNLPIGVQLMANHFEEHQLLQFTHLATSQL